VNAAAAGQLVTITCQRSQRRFLVDTWASFNLLPHHSSSPPAGQQLTGPTCAAIACWGTREETLLFYGCQFNWRFLLAAVSFPILGIDFMQSYGLMVDVAGHRLVSTANSEALLLAARSSGPTAAVLLPTSVATVKRTLRGPCGVSGPCQLIRAQPAVATRPEPVAAVKRALQG
jgi:hypothetical protein